MLARGMHVLFARARLRRLHRSGASRAVGVKSQRPTLCVRQVRRFSVTAAALFAGACSQRRGPVADQFDKPVAVSADSTLIHDADSVTFTARIRPDIARRMSPSGARDSADVFSHIVGWFWIPDLYAQDAGTRACASQVLVCRTAIYGAGTMVFSVRVGDEICADWVHIETLSYPDITGDDARARKHQDSVNAAMRTKTPTWQRCTA
jgi:hypothetical protein